MKDAENWHIACQAMQELSDELTAIANTHGVTFLCCDQASPLGLGVSQAIGPEFTQRVSSCDSEAMPVLVMPPPFSFGWVRFLVLDPRKKRRIECDPCNKLSARCTVTSITVEGHVDSIKFFCPRDAEAGSGASSLHRQRVLISLNGGGSVAVLKLLPHICIDRTALNGTEAFAQILAETTGAIGCDTPRSLHVGVDDDGCLVFTTEHLNSRDALILTSEQSRQFKVRPLVFPTAERFRLVSMDSASGAFATASVMGTGRTKISLWSFTCHGQDFPLWSLVKL